MEAETKNRQRVSRQFFKKTNKQTKQTKPQKPKTSRRKPKFPSHIHFPLKYTMLFFHFLIPTRKENVFQQDLIF